MSAHKSKLSRKQANKFAFREYMSSAFQRERGFLSKLELLNVCKVDHQQWLHDRDGGNPLPVICYTGFCDSESREMFSGFTTKERIAFNKECIRVFDEDHLFLSQLMLCKGLERERAFYARMVPVLKLVEEQATDYMQEDVCIVDHKGNLIASISEEIRSEDSAQHQKVQQICETPASPGGDDNSTFKRLDLVLDLVSPYLNCEDKIILDMALEGSRVRYQHNINLCKTNRRFRGVDQHPVDYMAGLNRHSYDGWIFSLLPSSRYYFPKDVHFPIPGCICKTDIRSYYRKCSYLQLRGISRRLDPLPRKRGKTFLGYNFTHVLKS